MRVIITAPSMKLDIDATSTVGELVREMEKHWTSSLLAGQRAAGGPLPTSSKGKPISGNGSIARDWTSSAVQGDKGSASATSEPGQEGGQFYQVRRMVGLNADPASTDGKAGLVIDEVVERQATKAVQQQP